LRARHVAALERWPQRSGAEFLREMQAVAYELSNLAREADGLRGDAIERARTWWDAAMAWDDLGSAGDVRALAEAEAASGKANALDPSGRSDIAALFAQLQGEVEHGKCDMDPVRRAGIEQFMPRLEASVKRGTEPARSTEGLDDETRLAALREDLLENVTLRGEMDRLFTEMLSRTKDPTLAGPAPPAGSRAARVLAQVQELKAFVMADAMPMHADLGLGKPGTAWDLMVRLGRLVTDVHASAGDEDALIRLEADRARTLANEVRRYARREHLGLARPVWSQRGIVVDPNTLFFSGPAAVGSTLAHYAARRRLLFNARPRAGADIAEARWIDLARANLAIFDISERDPQVFYEIGVALGLGTEILLVARAGTAAPFDIAQNVCYYDDGNVAAAFFDQHIDEAMYGVQVMGGQGSCLEATLVFAEQSAQPAAASDSRLRIALQLLRKALADPIQYRAALNNFNSALSGSPFVLVTPRWPIGYTQGGRPRCFIVMPFAKSWKPHSGPTGLLPTKVPASAWIPFAVMSPCARRSSTRSGRRRDRRATSWWTSPASTPMSASNWASPICSARTACSLVWRERRHDSSPILPSGAAIPMANVAGTMDNSPASSSVSSRSGDGCG
jgi:hypothetical protein